MLMTVAAKVPSMKFDPKHPVHSVEKTLEILETLSELESADLVELDEELPYGKSTIHNHLQTLKQHHYVLQDEGRYSLSLKHLWLGGRVRAGMEFFQKGKERIQELASETGELANMLSEEYGRGVYLYRARGDQAVDIDTFAGKETTLHDAALGKVILAEYSRDRVESIIDYHGLPKRTPHTITDRDTLFEELETIRTQGYATDDEERAQGVRCVAAAVTTPDEAVIGSISVSFPATRWSTDNSDVINQVKSMANVLELGLKYD